MLETRELFEQQGVGQPLLRLGDALRNHDDSDPISLREAHDKCLEYADGNGYARGCSIPIPTIDSALVKVVPSWVGASDYETRTVEGVLEKSKLTHTDFPLEPWHTYYDWNFYINVDRQYSHLLSESNVHDHGGKFECEWDTAYLPRWAWPQEGQRIKLIGRWIYDCGHPEDNGHKTEIHPPKAVVTFRSEGFEFDGNADSTRANQAVMYVGRDGGYWQQPINDQDYGFFLPLPPRPSPDAEPRYHVDAKTRPLAVEPQIAPFPAEDPRALWVSIPLQGVEPHPDEYGAIVTGGWSEPDESTTEELERIRVVADKIAMNADLDLGDDEWNIYVGINGRWQILKGLSGWEQSLDFNVDLDLHPDDDVRVTVCGLEQDVIYNHIGDDSGYSWDRISDPNLSIEERVDIEDDLFGQLLESFNDRNDRIGHSFDSHKPTETGSHVGESNLPVIQNGFPTSEPRYELHYRIERR